MNWVMLAHTEVHRSYLLLGLLLVVVLSTTVHGKFLTGARVPEWTES